MVWVYSGWRVSSFILSKCGSVETMQFAFTAIAVAAWRAFLGAKLHSLIIFKADKASCLSAGMISRLGKFKRA